MVIPRHAGFAFAGVCNIVSSRIWMAEYLVSQIQETCGAVQDVNKALSLFFVNLSRHFIQHQFGKADDNSERGAEVMRYGLSSGRCSLI
ncbi:MAG: hypothetical protein A2144_12140 [Chloroflexi bacterium RBG_16_50_9]|nr:MAG: hypothetical protein A2144_12140 [Chloroflexi bacterium RBG_16_50_9]